MSEKTVYVVSYWIANTGPYTRLVEMTAAEAARLEAILGRAAAAVDIYDVMLEPAAWPYDLARYLQEAEVLRRHHGDE